MNVKIHAIGRVVQILAILVVLIGAVWMWVGVSRWLSTRPVRAFHAEVDHLFDAFHKYREYVGRFPEGGNAQIVKALTGNNSRKIIIFSIKNENLNAKGEVVDPWGTPLKVYFSDRGVLVCSAGPNRVFEDSKVKDADDYFRSD